MKRRGATLIELLWLIASIATPIFAGTRVWHQTHSLLWTTMVSVLGLLAPTALLYISIFALGKIMLGSDDAPSKTEESVGGAGTDDQEAR